MPGRTVQARYKPDRFRFRIKRAESAAATDQYPITAIAQQSASKSGRDRVLRNMRASGCLLLLHGKEPFCEEYIPSKLYEYAWARRPILALTWKNPQLDGLLVKAGHDVVNAPDAEGVARCLETLYKRWANDELVDTMEAFQFPVGTAVNDILSLVGALDGNR